MMKYRVVLTSQRNLGLSVTYNEPAVKPKDVMANSGSFSC